MLASRLSSATAAALYEFSTFTFVPGTTSVRTGDTLSTFLTTYYNTTLYPWLLDTAFFNVVTAGIQQWTVPADGNYEFVVTGSTGGSTTSGLPAVITGTLPLTKGDVIHILVGKKGGATGNGVAGGGGSFVCLPDNTPLIVAGGGGGSSSTTYRTLYTNASLTTAGRAASRGAAGGVDGNGGTSSSRAGGGGGLLTNGSGTVPGTVGPGLAYVNGGEGGDGPTGDGGFGGGGGYYNTGFRGTGGGGGYSGGGAGYVSSDSATGGGGGGSYNIGANPSAVLAATATEGSVVVTRV